MTNTPLTFKEMCARFDVTPRTLRYYEYIELLSPQKDGRTRSYSGREIARMVLIMRGRRFGFSLEEIRQWLDMYENEGDQAQLQDWVGHANRQLKELKNQRQKLDESIAELQKLCDGTVKQLKIAKNG